MTLKRISAFCQETGYSEKAIRHKIDGGVWAEGCEYVRAPDGHLLVDTAKFDAWARSAATTGVSKKWAGRQRVGGSNPASAASASASRGADSGTQRS